MNTKIRRLFSVLLVLVMAFGLIPVNASASTVGGSCGNGVRWSLDPEGNLRISGSGEMNDFDSWNGESTAPWHYKMSSITSVVIGEGVTYIGSDAFCGYDNLTKVEISSTVAAIGNHAFAFCDNLSRVFFDRSIYQAALTRIEYSAFTYCTSLTEVDIPSGVTHIERWAFKGCRSLTNVTIPDSVGYILDGAFEDCRRLTNVTYDGTLAQWNEISIRSNNDDLLNANINCVHVHNYTSSVTAPTCTEDGYLTYTCDCGESYTEDGAPAVGHRWDGGEITRQPTENAEGVKTFTCENCGETKNESVPKLEHTHSYTSVVTAPTCVRGGYTTYTCECGDSYIDDEVDAIGHDWNDGEITREPTETTEGIMTFTCTRCDETRREEIPVLEPAPTDPPATEPPVVLPSIVGTYTTDLVMSAADLGVSAPDSVLRATLTFGEDGTASCTWEAVDLTALRMFFHDMFVNAYYAMAYGAGITDINEIEQFCMDSTGMSVSAYMDTLVTEEAMREAFTPAPTAGTYSYNGDHSAIYTDLAIMGVESDASVADGFVIGGDTLYLNAFSYGKADYTFVCTRR